MASVQGDAGGSVDSFECKREIRVGGRTYSFFSLGAAEEAGLPGVSSLPFSVKILLENLLRFEDGETVRRKDIEALVRRRTSVGSGSGSYEIAYRPARVLMQDFTGVPAIVDLAAMRDAVVRRGGNPDVINPQIPVDLVVDHSITVERYGDASAALENAAIEYRRNLERYTFLRWGSQSFSGFRVVPPGTGICHQVNLEYLAQVVSEREGGLLVPDTCIGTDSHTPMVNGLGVLGWGVGGIEAEAAMLGEPVTMLVPDVVGVRLVGKMRAGVTATDLVLTVTSLLRQKGVVGKFVEFFGDGLSRLSLEDRATVSNMTPEYGATVGYFPIDAEVLSYLERTGRPKEHIDLVESYARVQGLFYERGAPQAEFDDIVELDLDAVSPSVAGPRRPQDRVLLQEVPSSFKSFLGHSSPRSGGSSSAAGNGRPVRDGDVAIAAITSCTNTSNPGVMIAAGLLARKAVERGLRSKPWVKTSLAPGSKVVTDYLRESGLQDSLNQLGFYLVGYGCTTCIGNSGPLSSDMSLAANADNIVLASVLSGNRNFEARINPDVRASYLMSPPLVVAYALAGSVLVNLRDDPLGSGKDGSPVYLADIWPTQEEVGACVERVVKRGLFQSRYSQVFDGDKNWQEIPCEAGRTYPWSENSTYVRRVPFFDEVVENSASVGCVEGAAILGVFGDSVTTDHISPAGAIPESSPAGSYLRDRGVRREDFNAYGTRRGNHEVMVRGTFANTRVKNLLAPETEGGFTRCEGDIKTIWEAACFYRERGVPLVVLAGREYGTGSSRDWAAKGPFLLGVRAVLALSFERIHRSNLVGMGILPIQMTEDVDWMGLGVTAGDTVDIKPTDSGVLSPKFRVSVRIERAGGGLVGALPAVCRVDTLQEMQYLKCGGILQHVLKKLTA